MKNESWRIFQNVDLRPNPVNLPRSMIERMNGLSKRNGGAWSEARREVRMGLGVPEPPAHPVGDPPWAEGGGRGDCEDSIQAKYLTLKRIRSGNKNGIRCRGEGQRRGICVRGGGEMRRGGPTNWRLPRQARPWRQGPLRPKGLQDTCAIPGSSCAAGGGRATTEAELPGVSCRTQFESNLEKMCTHLKNKYSKIGVEIVITKIELLSVRKKT